jgi:hypothetical protein
MAPFASGWRLDLSYGLHMAVDLCILISAIWLFAAGVRKVFVFLLAGSGLAGALQMIAQISQNHFQTRLLFGGHYYYLISEVRDALLGLGIVLFVVAMLRKSRGKGQQI